MSERASAFRSLRVGDVAVLDPADVATYLIERNLLSAQAVVDGDLRVMDASRRNRVFVVVAEHERCFVLKLAGEVGDAGVDREAAVLERLGSADVGGELASRLPTMVEYDAAEGVLILEATPDARDLTRHHACGRFSRTLAHEAGRALALLHAVPLAVLSGLASYPDPTWTLQMHRPDLDTLHTLSAASVELIRTIQRSDEICTGLDELRASWRGGSVIHGDMRWDNCLALRGGKSRRRTRLLLIDWEWSRAGDPGLDIGAFFGEYLHAWVQSVPIVDPREPGRLLGHARLPLRRMQPALRSFWDAYTRHRGVSAAELSRILRRATRFAGARLIEAALEEAQTTAELRGSACHTLQLGANVLRRPDEAAAHLLGLRASWAPA
jgi:aminoglycoside phosphotransferase (APT) family kinase protein